MAHEVNHSVRILNGPGVGTTLLPQIITEGIATAFDQAAFKAPQQTAAGLSYASLPTQRA